MRDAFRVRTNRRPLYDAIKKYGKEHFYIELIEETNSPDEREKFWIEYYDTFNNGYNATVGGDGKRYCDYDSVLQLYNEGKSIREIASILHYDTHTCSAALRENHISAEDKIKHGRNVIKKRVAQIDINSNEIIHIYDSLKDAYAVLGKEQSGHIASVCNGDRKIAYGYKWRYVD